MAHIRITADDDARLVIDPTTRRIEGCAVELVQGDHDSERIGFEIPRYIDGHDMTEATAYIHYCNEESDEGHMYPVDDLHALPNSPNTVVFTWLASRNVTKDAGRVIFLVKFRCVEDGEVVYEWNTALAKLVRVKEGAAFEAEAVEVLPDIILVWKAELEATVPRLLEETLQEAKDSGEFDGVGVSSVEQVESGVGSDAVNVVRVSLSDGRAFDFEVRNGSQGEKGDSYILTENDKAEIAAAIKYIETDPTVPAWAKEPTKPTYTADEVGALPNTTVIPTIPTNVSAFSNDAGYAKSSELATVAKSGSYNDLEDKPTIPTVPTNVSAFANDSGYQTEAQVNALINTALGVIENGAY